MEFYHILFIMIPEYDEDCICPIKGRPWEYCFFVDFEGNLEDPAVKNAIRGLREEATNLKILGNY